MKKDNRKGFDWNIAMNIAFGFSAWIIMPVVIGFFLGSYLDKRFSSSPRYFLISLGLSFVVSIFGLTRYVLKESKKIDENYKKNQIKKD